MGRKLLAGLILLAGFGTVGLFYAAALQGQNPAESDFIGYWAGARQLVQRANPYDQQACLALERAAGYAASEPRITPSPPIALVLLAPAGLLGPKAGLFTWTMTMLALLAFSLWRLARLLGASRSLLPLTGFLFAPALTCLQAGQLGILFLVSAVLFLELHHSRPFLSGLALLPLALKPHLFLPFGVALLAWIVARRSWPIFAGVATAILAGIALTLILDPGVWGHYNVFLHTSALENRYTPTLSVGLPLLFHAHAESLRFIPTGLACLWAVLFVRSRGLSWQWSRQGLIVLAISLVTTPYAWFTDEAVLLPAVLVVLLRPSRARWAVLTVAALPLIELALGADIKSWAFVWTPLAWFACAVYAAKKKGGREPKPTAA